MKAVAIIPARGGSKRVPGKNIRELAGKPLLAYTIEAALGAKGLDSVYVSTEDKEIAKLAKERGAQVIDRPAELATDEASTKPVLEHALAELGGGVDALVLLQPTSPLRGPADIDAALEKFESSGCDSLLSVSEKRHFYWRRESGELKRLYEKRIRTQEMEPWLEENGAIYVTTKSVLENNDDWLGGSIENIIMDETSSIDIDTEFDFWLAEKILERRQNGQN